MAIGIIGGGLTGCLMALQIAEAGRRVVLFEKETALIARASLSNEGKVHLGFVYAADASFRTARRMVDDALSFRSVIERWIGASAFEASVFDPFDYYVPEGSMLTVDRIAHHFAKVARYLEAQSRARGVTYLGQEDAHVVTRAEAARPGLRAIFRSGERGVMPGMIADALARAVRVHPRIEVRTGARVTALRRDGALWRADVEGEAAAIGPFDAIANCAWIERRILDAASGFGDADEWLYRFKYGILLEDASEALGGVVPRNATAVLGAYGDSVYYPQNDSLYCSWYPVGMCHSTTDLRSDAKPDPGDPATAIERSWRGYATLDPAYEVLLRKADRAKARLVGDFIAAKAKTDIDDPWSRLHQRDDHGHRMLAPGYWTVETSKYTSAGRCADECARAMLALH